MAEQLKDVDHDRSPQDVRPDPEVLADQSRQPEGSAQMRSRLMDSERGLEAPDRPPISEEKMNHVLDGNLNAGGTRGTGWHHSPDGQLPEGRRYAPNAVVTPLENSDDASSAGVYSVRNLQFQDSAGEWEAAKAKSTFYPDDWSRDQVVQAVNESWNDSEGTRDDDATWTGTDSKGFRVTGYYDQTTGEMATAWPDYQPNQ